MLGMAPSLCPAPTLQAGDRKRTALALPPDGLALVGVGYDTESLGTFRGLPSNPAKLARLDSAVEGFKREYSETGQPPHAFR